MGWAVIQRVTWATLPDKTKQAIRDRIRQQITKGLMHAIDKRPRPVRLVNGKTVNLVVKTAGDLTWNPDHVLDALTDMLEHGELSMAAGGELSVNAG